MNVKKLLVVALVFLILLSTTVTFLVFSQAPDIETYQETEIDIQILVSVQNLGHAAAFDIPLRLALPANQTRSQNRDTALFSVEPERWSDDSLGNEFIHYTIPRLEPQTTADFYINLSLTLMSVDFNIREESIGDYADVEENLSSFLGPSAYINFNEPEVIQLARQISNDSDSLEDIPWNTYEWLIDNIYYQQIPGEWDAATTLKNGEGGSAELGNLFVALLRANGIPARRLSGWGNHFEEGEELALTRFAHGWGEFYLPGYGWVPADPTWGKSHKFDNYARADNEHVVLTRGADIHFLHRGRYTVQHEETEIDTDYTLFIGDIQINNLSWKRDVIAGVVLACPVFFALFIVSRQLKQRHV